MLLYAKNELQIALDRHSLIRSKVSLSQGLFRKSHKQSDYTPILSFQVVQNPYHYVSVNGLKSCMTRLLYLFDKVLIKAPIKMHSKPSYAKGTAVQCGFGFVMLRQARSTVLSRYVQLNLDWILNLTKYFLVLQHHIKKTIKTMLKHSHIKVYRYFKRNSFRISTYHKDQVLSGSIVGFCWVLISSFIKFKG